MSQLRLFVVITTIVILTVVATATITALVVGNTGNESTATTPPSVAAVDPSNSELARHPWMEMETSGELHAMLQRHQAMMQQMQVNATPQMLEMMRTDPMWRMLDSGELMAQMEQHQADIDRMLAQPGG